MGLLGIDKPVVFYFVGDIKNKSFYQKFVNLITKKKLNKKCRILDHLNNEDLKMMYHCSNLIISAPLKPEGFGRTISESLSMEKILLAYNFGGVQDQLRDLDNIYKVIPKDHNQMIFKINNLLNL